MKKSTIKANDKNLLEGKVIMKKSERASVEKRVLRSEQGKINKPSDTWQTGVWKGIGPPHFTCEVCNLKYSKKLEFTEHLFKHREEEEKERQTTCLTCFSKFDNQESLFQHCENNKDHGRGQTLYTDTSGEPVIKMFECPQCPSKFKEGIFFDIHIKTHELASISCAECNESFQYDFELETHMLEHHYVPDKKCKLVVEGVKMLKKGIMGKDYLKEKIKRQEFKLHEKFTAESRKDERHRKEQREEAVEKGPRENVQKETHKENMITNAFMGDFQNMKLNGKNEEFSLPNEFRKLKCRRST